MEASLVQKNQWWILFHQNRVLVKKSILSNKVILSSQAQDWIESGLSYPTDHIQYFQTCNLNPWTCYQCSEITVPFPAPASWTWLTLRELAYGMKTWENFQVFSHAYQILNWYKNHQFCGQCGQRTQRVPQLFVQQCLKCHLDFYPPITPAILVIVQREDTLLLARSHHFYPGVYGAIAGFLEVGETAEEAVQREIQEEVGISIKNVSYQMSQSWPFPHCLMLGYFAEYASGEIQIDHHEIEDARWFHQKHLPELSMEISLGRKLIQRWLLKKNSYQTP